MLNEYDIYRSIEFAIFASYLIFIYLLIQIWLLWRNIDKNKLRITLVSDSFFKRNCIYVFSASIFLMVHEFFEETALPNTILYLEFFELLVLISLLLFTYDWYSVLRTCAHKKALPQELINSTLQEV